MWTAVLAQGVMLFGVMLMTDLHRRRRAEVAAPAPECREPRDLSRPYPKRVITGPDDKRLTTCPVCGMEDPFFLDGGPSQASFFGWPAHATCVEWIGDWKPEPAYIEIGGMKIPPPPAHFCTPAPARAAYPGGTTVPAGWPLSIPRPEPGFGSAEWAENRAADGIRQMTEAANLGMITMGELRERIAGAFGYPEISISASSETTGTATCDCEMSFSGSAADLGRSMDVHRASGQHEQRMAYLRSKNA